MYLLLRSQAWKDILSVEAPAFGLSLLTAEQFYKFHSFTLECAAFLVTWYVLSGVVAASRRVVARLLSEAE